MYGSSGQSFQLTATAILFSLRNSFPGTCALKFKMEAKFAESGIVPDVIDIAPKGNAEVQSAQVIIAE